MRWTMIGLRRWRFAIGVATILGVSSASSRAADFGAVQSGAWSTASTWTTGGPPGATDNVYIGNNNFPAGTIATATVNLTGNATTGNIYLGFGTTTNGTLDLGTHKITASTLQLGNINDGTAAITRAAGSIVDVGTVNVQNGNSFELRTADTVGSIFLDHAGSLTTAGATSLQSVFVNGNSTVTINGSITTTNNFDITTGTVHFNNQDVTTSVFNAGYYGGTAAFTNLGHLKTTYLLLGTNQNLTLSTGSEIGALSLGNNAKLTTSAAGNFSNASSILQTDSSQLTLGTALLADTIDLRGTSTLDANSKNLTANTLYLGTSGGTPTLANRGVLTITTMFVKNQNFNVNATDAVQYFTMEGASTTLASSVATKGLTLSAGATGTTSAVSNVTDFVSINDSTLVVGSNMTLVNAFSLSGPSTVNFQSKNLTASSIDLGYSNTVTPTITARGNFTATTLRVGKQ
ncbi:MAG: beta strand repeat-containing protein, partial [Gemmataceae bacterium]